MMATNSPACTSRSRLRITSIGPRPAPPPKVSARRSKRSSGSRERALTAALRSGLQHAALPVGVVTGDQLWQERVITLQHALDIGVGLQSEFLEGGQHVAFGRLHDG